MEKIILNEDKLLDSDIDVVVTRVKVFLMNDKNEIMVARSGGGCQLPGGHVEEGEDLFDTVIREIKEETGMVLERDDIVEPFFEVSHYIKNYKNLGINRVAKIIYYLVRTNRTADISNINLTENEKNNNFVIDSINFDDFEIVLNDIKHNNEKEINRVIATEILYAFGFLKKHLTKE